MLCHTAAVTIGFSFAEYSTVESNLSVCVSVLSGQLGPNVIVTYSVTTISDTASGKMHICIGCMSTQRG